MHVLRTLSGLALVLGLVAGSARAQDVERPWVLEGRAGIGVPTFDIADLADPGVDFGVGVGYYVTDRVLLLAEGDLGLHSGAGEGAADVNVFHYMGKVGYRLYQSGDQRLTLVVNAGAGALTFDPDVEGADAQTNFAINAGAKLYYLLGENIGVVVSPQGDIAFTDEDDGFTGSTAWVWPFTAGVYVRF